LDPFCGTGGILIEAGLMGLKIKGSDIDQRMVEGCRKNLESLNLKGEIKRGDALKQGSMRVDAIVTDPPYARSSYVTDKNLGGLYNEFLSTAFNNLRHGGYLVLMVPKRYPLDTGRFSLIEEFDFRVHKSLTRKIFVMKKP
jgi:tRNA (guanine10-N2)-dimethyltransferase